MSLQISFNGFLGLACCFVLAVLLYAVLQLKNALSKNAQRYTQPQSKDGKVQSDDAPDFAESYPPVEPREDFDWATTEPLQIRAFKPMYHLTMGLTNIDVSSLIEMDKNYLDRIYIRRELIKNHEETVLAAHPSVKPAVDEFYSWLLGTYLPTRYPRMFMLCEKPADNETPAYKEKGVPTEKSGAKPDKTRYTHLVNHATQEVYPLEPPTTPIETLRAIGGIIDDDCQFLLPSEDGDGYTLQGLACCFPNGFNMSKKLGLKLREIHIPVPHYKEKIEKSMDRFFGRLQVGSFMRRINWTISVKPDLFNPHGNHLYAGDTIPDDSDVDPSSARLRSELQVLHRLPRTKALLFSFKTYTYPLQQIKDEGLGEQLAEAIDGMRDGTAPGIHRYKKAVVWGEKVKAFLSE